MIKHIFCIGGANIDCKLKSSVNLTLSTSNPVFSTSSYGGVARNVAQNLIHWTTNIHLQCVVGDDAYGRQMLDHIRLLGVNVEHCVVLADKKTSHYYAILDSDGELFVALADMNIYDELTIVQFTPAWDSWSSQSLIFLDTNLPAELIGMILKQAVARNLLVCIDAVSVTKAQKLPYNLEQVFLLKADRLEASVLTHMEINSVDDCLCAGRKLRRRGVKHAVLTLGRLGYVVVNELCEEYIAIPQIDRVIDTSGAGDAFIAGILLGLQHNETMLRACQLGAAAAAYTVQSIHTVAPDISMSHLYAYIKKHPVHHETTSI